MKKYNKSEIMKNAWVIFKAKAAKSFSDALRTAWENAKKVKRIVGKKIQIIYVAKWILKKMTGVQFLALDAGIAVDDIVLERETGKAIEISTEWNYRRIRIWMPKSAVQYTLQEDLAWDI